jgi:electron transport complex protein RnfC
MKIDMDISFFRRGIQLARQPLPDPTKEVPLPSRVAVLLGQEAGLPCKKMVEVGDEVRAGQKVASSTSGGADFHASVSGKVAKIEEFLLLNGSRCDGLIIENDGMDRKEDLKRDDSPLSSNANELLRRISAAGIMQGRGKVKPLFDLIKSSSTVGQIVVRFSDPDPYFSAMDVVTRELGDGVEKVLLGVEVMKKITGARSVCLAFDKKQKVPKLEKLARENKWAVRRFDAYNYPALSDPMLYRSVLGRELDVSANTPNEKGLLIVDINTLLQVTQAVRYGRPVIEQKIVVRGPKASRTLNVRSGMLLSDIVEVADCCDEIGKVVLGGPLLGKACHSLNYPLTKDINGLTLFPRGGVDLATNNLCISCGLCAKVCPMRLIPGMLSRFCEFGGWDHANGANLFSCIECGCCGYVCPAGRSLVQLFAHGKSEFLAMQRSDS